MAFEMLSKAFSVFSFCTDWSRMSLLLLALFVFDGDEARSFAPSQTAPRRNGDEKGDADATVVFGVCVDNPINSLSSKLFVLPFFLFAVRMSSVMTIPPSVSESIPSSSLLVSLSPPMAALLL